MIWTTCSTWIAMHLLQMRLTFGKVGEPGRTGAVGTTIPLTKVPVWVADEVWFLQLGDIVELRGFQCLHGYGMDIKSFYNFIQYEQVVFKMYICKYKTFSKLIK